MNRSLWNEMTCFDWIFFFFFFFCEINCKWLLVVSIKLMTKESICCWERKFPAMRKVWWNVGLPVNLSLLYLSPSCTVFMPLKANIIHIDVSGRLLSSLAPWKRHPRIPESDKFLLVTSEIQELIFAFGFRIRVHWNTENSSRNPESI